MKSRESGGWCLLIRHLYWFDHWLTFALISVYYFALFVPNQAHPKLLAWPVRPSTILSPHFCLHPSFTSPVIELMVRIFMRIVEPSSICICPSEIRAGGMWLISGLYELAKLFNEPRNTHLIGQYRSLSLPSGPLPLAHSLKAADSCLALASRCRSEKFCQSSCHCFCGLHLFAGQISFSFFFLAAIVSCVKLLLK